MSTATVEITTPDELETRYHELFDQLALLEERVQKTLETIISSQEESAMMASLR